MTILNQKKVVVVEVVNIKINLEILKMTKFLKKQVVAIPHLVVRKKIVPEVVQVIVHPKWIIMLWIKLKIIF